MQRVLILLIAGLVVIAKASTPTINGHAVSVAWRGGWDYEGSQRGSIMKVTILNGAVASRDTIYSKKNGLAQYPALNLAGDKVAFYRWARTTIGAGETFGTSPNNTIAVVNIDGSGLTDLATLPAAPGTEPVLDWPAGDWVYYKKSVAGSNDIERDIPDVWRVNVKDPSLNHRVVYYTGWWLPSHELRRWSVSLDGNYSIGQFGVMNGWGNQNVFHTFPPKIGDYAPSGVPFFGALPGCNGSISASGMYAATYFAGVHPDFSVSKWDHSTNIVEGTGKSVSVTDIGSWTGQPIGLGGELIRWAVNSDKWVLQQIGWYGHAGSIVLGTQQVAANWVDRQAIILSANPKLPDNAVASYGACPGDLWIDGGAANAGKYEDVNGNWIPVAPVGMYAKIDWTGAHPFTVTLTSAPVGGDIYYTTDGSTPTQSSTHYSAPFSLTAPPGLTTCLKVRAFRTGIPDGGVVSKLFVPSSKPLGINVKELLCLENASGKMAIESADTVAILDKYAGENKSLPFGGDQVAANGRTYTWHLRSNSDGIWLPSGANQPFPAFFFFNVIAPEFIVDSIGVVSNLITPYCAFNYTPIIYRNGARVAYLDGHSDSMSLQRFTLDKGANGIFVHIHSWYPTGKFAIQFLGVDGTVKNDLSYFPYSGVGAMVNGHTVAPTMQRSKTIVRYDRGFLNIGIGASGMHRVILANVNGQTLRTWQGIDLMAIKAEVNPGIYLVCVAGAEGESVKRIMIR